MPIRAISWVIPSGRPHRPHSGRWAVEVSATALAAFSPSARPRSATTASPDSLTGVLSTDAAGQWEPDEATASRPVLRAPGGEILPSASPRQLPSELTMNIIHECNAQLSFVCRAVQTAPWILVLSIGERGDVELPQINRRCSGIAGRCCRDRARAIGDGVTADQPCNGADCHGAGIFFGQNLPRSRR